MRPSTPPHAPPCPPASLVNPVPPLHARALPPLGGIFCKEQRCDYVPATDACLPSNSRTRIQQGKTKNKKNSKASTPPIIWNHNEKHSQFNHCSVPISAGCCCLACKFRNGFYRALGRFLMLPAGLGAAATTFLGAGLGLATGFAAAGFAATT